MAADCIPAINLAANQLRDDAKRKDVRSSMTGEQDRSHLTKASAEGFSYAEKKQEKLTATTAVHLRLELHARTGQDSAYQYADNIRCINGSMV